MSSLITADQRSQNGGYGQSAAGRRDDAVRERGLLSSPRISPRSATHACVGKPEIVHDSQDHVTLIGKIGSAPEIKPVANGQMLTLNLGVQVVSCTSSTDSR